VNVCAVPASFVAVNGEIEIRASTHVFTAFALSPLRPSPLVRVSETPPTENVVVALNVVTPVALELRLTVQLPPLVAH